MATLRCILLLGLCAIILLNAYEAQGAITKYKQAKINRANAVYGPFLGLIIPEKHDLQRIYEDPKVELGLDAIQISGRRFELGRFGHKYVIMAVSGTGMINAGVTTQLMLTNFDIEGLVHLGVAGNVDPSLNVGDVVIPREWAHTSLWSLQKYGQGESDPLPLESTGRYTRELGYLKFADFTANVSTPKPDNLLNRIWYQHEEVFPVDGNGEEGKLAFWVEADHRYINMATKLEGLNLESCVGDTCLPEPPRLAIVGKGSSNNFYIDNAAYREFIHKKFKVTSVDMESAGVALVCLQEKVPFIVIRGLSNLAGGGSSSNEADKFKSLAIKNAYISVVEFIKSMGGKMNDAFIEMV